MLLARMATIYLQHKCTGWHYKTLGQQLCWSSGPTQGSLAFKAILLSDVTQAVSWPQAIGIAQTSRPYTSPNFMASQLAMQQTRESPSQPSYSTILQKLLCYSSQRHYFAAPSRYHHYQHQNDSRKLFARSVWAFVRCWCQHHFQSKSYSLSNIWTTIIAAGNLSPKHFIKVHVQLFAEMLFHWSTLANLIFMIIILWTTIRL